MIDFHTLQKLTARIKSTSSESSFKSSIMHPAREWLIGLAVTCVLLLGVGAYSAYLYSVVVVTPDLTSEQVDVVVPYRAALVAAALAEYRDLEAQYVTAQQITTPPVTPPIENNATTTNSTSTTTSSTAPTSTTTPSTEPDTVADTPEPAPAPDQTTPELAF